MLNANQNLMRAAQTAGNIIYTNIVGEPELTWEMEDALSMPLSPRAAATAALVLAYTLARTRSGSRKHRDAILRHWENINDPSSDLRFIPATPLALRLLHAIPGKAGEKALHILDEAIRRLENPARAADQLQKLAEDRKQMGVYHTLPASADLMAHLAVPQDDRWADPQKAGEFRMADYACGAGELLTAAYRRVRELHKGGGGNPREIHDRMMTQGITAVDLLPASLAIAATELEMLEPIPRGGRGASTPSPSARDPSWKPPRGRTTLQERTDRWDWAALTCWSPRKSSGRSRDPLGGERTTGWERSFHTTARTWW